MDSPQRRRIPPQVPPLHSNHPVPAPNPVSLICSIKSWAIFNINIISKARYNHLPIDLQQQLAALPPLMPLRSRAPTPAPAPAPAAPIPVSL